MDYLSLIIIAAMVWLSFVFPLASFPFSCTIPVLIQIDQMDNSRNRAALFYVVFSGRNVITGKQPE
jgi:hypothetical protein